MNSPGKAVVATMLGFFISQLCGCASSGLVDIWHDSSLKDLPLGKILVIAVTKDATRRRIWEDAFAVELTKHSMVATTSYSLFPDAPPDTNQVITTAQENSFDGVLAVFRRSRETNTRYIHGYTSTEQSVRYNPYWQRYRTYYLEIEHPGYIDSQIVDIRTIDVSTTGNGGRLIWSATSRTPDPGSVTDVQSEIVSLVISELVQRNIIKSGK